MGDRVTKKEIDNASEVHVVDYLRSKGEEIVQQGNKYYRHAEHSSLVFHENGKWFWNSKGVGGHGAISLARELYGMKFQDAVRDVNGLEIDKTLRNELNSSNKDFSYPKNYEIEGIENATNYLINERGIDGKVVLALQKHDLIAEDKMKNLVFKWKDKDGKVVGAERQGTVKMDNKRGSFKSIVANSKLDGGFSLDIGKPNKIAIFESPIDAISYFDLKRPNNIRLKAMSGLKDQTAMTSIRGLLKECHERNEKVEAIIIAVDNDKAGKEFVKRWESILAKPVIEVPINKDWNDDLKKQRELQKTKQDALTYSKNQSLER